MSNIIVDVCTLYTVHTIYAGNVHVLYDELTALSILPMMLLHFFRKHFPLFDRPTINADNHYTARGRGVIILNM